MASQQSRPILRYRIGRRLVHTLLASSFLLLLATGLILLWPRLSPWAAGGDSRLLHRIGAVLFMAVPLVYLLVDVRAAKELLWDSFHYDRDDRQWIKASYRYFLGYAAEMPPQGRLNAGQKLHHAGVVLSSAAIVASGLVLWFAKGSLGAQGLAYAAILHDLSMLVLTVLLAGHLYFTFVYRALSAMTTGYVSEEAAQLEHAKWVASIRQEAEPPHPTQELQPH
ncbi:MAG: cytochrome b/b6 domain-containing protein [Caldilineaceae bacterium]|nr:cytochrome b/b6 domain-containing protein [Caldilineaceae bacterium]